MNQRIETFFDKLLHLTTAETVIPEIKNIEGVSSVKINKDERTYSFRKVSESKAYLILRVSSNGKLISALYYPDKKNGIH